MIVSLYSVILPPSFKVAGGILTKIDFAARDANSIIQSGTYIQNLYSADLLNYPDKDVFAIIEAFKSVRNDGTTYICQRLTTFNGKIYVRAKVGTAEWIVWKKVGAV